MKIGGQKFSRVEMLAVAVFVLLVSSFANDTGVTSQNTQNTAAAAKSTHRAAQDEAGAKKEDPKCPPGPNGEEYVLEDVVGETDEDGATETKRKCILRELSECPGGIVEMTLITGKTVKACKGGKRAVNDSIKNGHTIKEVKISAEDAGKALEMAAAELHMAEKMTTGMPMDSMMAAWETDADKAAKDAAIMEQATKIRDEGGNRVDIVDTPSGKVIRETRTNESGTTAKFTFEAEHPKLGCIWNINT